MDRDLEEVIEQLKQSHRQKTLDQQLQEFADMDRSLDSNERITKKLNRGNEYYRAKKKRLFKSYTQKTQVVEKLEKDLIRKNRSNRKKFQPNKVFQDE